MNVTVSHIRSALQECYPPREAANLSRIVCCEMLGQSHIDYYLGKDMILSPKDEKELESILSRLCNFESEKEWRNTIMSKCLCSINDNISIAIHHLPGCWSLQRALLKFQVE